MFKKYRKIIIVLLFISLSYLWVWFETYNRTSKFYQQASYNTEQGNYMSALKGKRTLNHDESGYVFKGGFQQVIEAWDSPYAIPKPDIYKKSEESINTIINKKIDIATGNRIFQSYFKLDNKYLPEILLRIGDLQEEQGQLSKAKDIYTMVLEAFARNKEAAKYAEEKLNQLDTNIKER